MKHIILLVVAAISLTVFLNSCSKEYSYEKAIPAGNAVFSLKDSLGNCLPDTVHGTFYNGVTPGSDTAFVELQVNVDSVGNYKIYTDLQNGFMFADSGFFNTTGPATVLLKPLGTPILQTVTTFKILSDTTFCNFLINVQDSTGTGLGSNPGGPDSTNLSDTAWKFSVAAATFNGPVDTAFIYTDTSGAKFLTVYGYTPATSDTAFAVSIYLQNDTIAAGNYSTTTEAGLYFKDLQDTATTHFIYHADPTTTNAGINFTLTYDSSTHIVEATFNGTALDLTGNVITITNGRFKVKVT
jgi:hypothetical protein